MIKKVFKRLIGLWFLWPILFLMGCTMATLGVLGDNEPLQALGATAAVLSVAMMAVVFAASLVMRRFAVSVGVAVSAVGTLALGVVAAIMIGAGQHHPPRQMDEGIYIPLWSEMEHIDSAHVSRAGTDLDKGSWWTDGVWFYEVKQTGATIVMEGYGLHEGGAVCAFEADGDRLLSVMPGAGYTTFGRVGHEVHHFMVTGDDDKTYEVLIACSPDAPDEPWRLLQRCDVEGDDEKMLAFVEQGMSDVLEGVYAEDTDGERLWHFHADATVQMPGMERPEPYAFELGYNQPTGVIRLPDGSRVAVVLTDGALQLYEAEYVDDDECWEGTDRLLSTLDVTGTNVAAGWAYSRPALPSLLVFADSAYRQTLRSRLEGICDGMAVLNYYLLPFIDDDDETSNDAEGGDDN